MDRTSKRTHCSAGRILMLVLALTVPLFAQKQSTSAIWRGLVKNSVGTPIAGAKVRLKGTFTAASSTAADGSFSLAALPAGKYKLTIVADGTTATYAQTITLTSDSAAVVITVSKSREITVATQQQTDQKGGEKLSSQKVNELPLNGRDFSTLLLLAAGTMTDANGATNFTQQFAINGQRGVEATFAMDGSDTSDPEMGGGTFTNFNVDAVEEIQSNSGWMPAQIGQGAAGLTNVVTRSGSSGFHGSFFEFLRNSVLDARNYFDYSSIANPGRLPPFRRNEFGFTNGGPVVLPHIYNGSNRTFYFGQYQGFRQTLGTTQVFPVPTEQERAGLDSTAFPGDVLTVPIDPGIARVL